MEMRNATDKKICYHRSRNGSDQASLERTPLRLRSTHHLLRSGVSRFVCSARVTALSRDAPSERLALTIHWSGRDYE
jgi:hypothetical protein